MDKDSAFRLSMQFTTPKEKELPSSPAFNKIKSAEDDHLKINISGGSSARRKLILSTRKDE